MRLSYYNGNYTFLRDNGETVKLSADEINYIVDMRRADGWANKIDEAIDDNNGYIDFSQMDRQLFVDLCVEDLQNRWDMCDQDEKRFGTPDYDGLVFDIAQENGIWRD